MSEARRLAILDDFQGVALDHGDWTKVGDSFAIDVFRDWLPPGEERARILAPYEVIVAMRERTPFPAALIDALRALAVDRARPRRHRPVRVVDLRAGGERQC